MQELIIPEHYKTDEHGSNSGLVYIYQRFVNDLLTANKMREGAMLSALIEKANIYMQAFLYGTAMKYDYRKGRKIYEYRGKEVSEEIDTTKRDFYLTEWSRLVLVDKNDGLQKPIYPLMPALVEYRNVDISRITEYLTLIGE
jgi:hypothetical protein